MLYAIPVARVHRGELFQHLLRLLDRVALLEVDGLGWRQILEQQTTLIRADLVVREVAARRAQADFRCELTIEAHLTRITVERTHRLARAGVIGRELRDQRSRRTRRTWLVAQRHARDLPR